MSEIVKLLETNGQIVAAAGMGLLALMLLILVILQIRLLQRVKKVQSKVDTVTERVGSYLTVILDSEAEAEEMDKQTIALQEKMQREEEENRIISAVLQEIFP